MHNKGRWNKDEVAALKVAMDTYAANSEAFEDGTFEHELWGMGGGQTTNVLTWLVRSVGTRRAGAVAARVQKLLATMSRANGTAMLCVV